MNINEFISKAQLIHGDKYDYSELVFKTTKVKGTIICKKHNETFEQYLSGHLAGKGCFKCGYDNKKTSITKFIENARKIHNDKYDYSKFVYVTNKTKGIIICKEHGEFLQSPSNHMKSDCPSCAKILTITTEDFIKKAKEIHNDLYDYSEFIYNGAAKKSKIICKKHGMFLQHANSHLNNHGCPKCATVIRTNGVKKYKQSHISLETLDILNNKDRFSELFKKYTIYELANQLKINEETIKRYGKQYGIQIKSNSSYENKIIDFLESHSIQVKRNDRTFIRPKEIDIFTIKHKIGIEFTSFYWHGKKQLSIRNDSPETYHIQKTIDAENNGGKLITIFEDEWLYHRNKVENALLSIFGIHPISSITDLQIVTTDNDFLQRYSFYSDSILDCQTYSAIDSNNEVIASLVISNDIIVDFSTNKSNREEIFHYMIEHNIKKNKPERLEYIFDRRGYHCNPPIYFKLVEEIEPFCWFTKNYKKYKSLDELLEKQVSKNNKFDILWDCGYFRYIYTK